MQRALTIGCVVWTATTLATVAPAIAQTTRPVHCSAGETVATALAAAKPGDTLTVRGVCKENAAANVRAHR